ncbi:MAG: ATP-binding cassette domain-containing protein [Oscillospiraceae bacterium]|nr:ATP-binding cassette domain-containing protein [Oscillospiraceae bacterium]
MNIELSNVSKSFGEKIVLKDLSISFPFGKTTCMMGKSGCGKTTVLSILMGFVSPDAGEVLGVPAHIRTVFQEDRLCESFSAGANIRMATGKPKEEIEQHLQELGLGDCVNKRVSTMSGGMKRRVAIARAVAADGELLLLDEPLKGLDIQTKSTVMEYLKKRTAGKTVIMVTHDRAEVDFLSHNTIHMVEYRGGTIESE